MFSGNYRDMLLRDLRAIGIPMNFTLELRGYSKTYFGLYDPNDKKVILYIYRDPELKHRYSYAEVLEQAVHECVHHIQWEDPYYVRHRGVMHNPQFYRLLEEYNSRAKTMLLFREVESYDTQITRVIPQMLIPLYRVGAETFAVV